MSNTLQTIHPDTVETLMPMEHTEATMPMEHTEATTHATTEHAGPHIPSSKGEIIPGWSLAGSPITNTIFSTWLFMAVFFVIIAVFYTAITTRALPRVRTFGLDVVSRIFSYATGLLGNAQMARRYMWLLGGIIVVVFIGNIFGLILDWFVLISAGNWLAEYLRPMYSDLSTTLVLSTTVILTAQVTAFAMK
jgi:F0F1-type ATP synthase membrane subunit a